MRWKEFGRGQCVERREGRRARAGQTFGEANVELLGVGTVMGQVALNAAAVSQEQHEPLLLRLRKHWIWGDVLIDEWVWMEGWKARVGLTSAMARERSRARRTRLLLSRSLLRKRWEKWSWRKTGRWAGGPGMSMGARVRRQEWGGGCAAHLELMVVAHSDGELVAGLRGAVLGIGELCLCSTAWV